MLPETEEDRRGVAEAEIRRTHRLARWEVIGPGGLRRGFVVLGLEEAVRKDEREIVAVWLVAYAEFSLEKLRLEAGLTLDEPVGRLVGAVVRWSQVSTVRVLTGPARRRVRQSQVSLSLPVTAR